jgi:hypothetical protein
VATGAPEMNRDLFESFIPTAAALPIFHGDGPQGAGFGLSIFRMAIEARGGPI